VLSSWPRLRWESGVIPLANPCSCLSADAESTVVLVAARLLRLEIVSFVEISIAIVAMSVSSFSKRTSDDWIYVAAVAVALSVARPVPKGPNVRDLTAVR
jgi:hypothetical protein